MSLFTANDAIGVLGLAAFNYAQFGHAPVSQVWYNKQRPAWAPPGWVFPLAWFLLYAMTTVAGYYFLHMVPSDSWQLTAGFTLYTIHMVANKLWSVFFWPSNDGSKRGPLIALLILVLIMLPTGLAFLIVAGIDNFPLYQVPVALFSVYMAWLVYATFLNAYWVMHKIPTTTTTNGYKRFDNDE